MVGQKMSCKGGNHRRVTLSRQRQFRLVTEVKAVCQVGKVFEWSAFLEEAHQSRKTAQKGLKKLPGVAKSSAAIAATKRVGDGLKCSSVERGVDLGDHLGQRWPTGVAKCPESDGAGNLANKTPLPEATMVAPGRVEGLD